jgi:hypothetical protein
MQPRALAPSAILFSAMFAAACRPSATATRPLALVSRDVTFDRALAQGQRLAFEGTPRSLAAAEQALRDALRSHGTEPLAQAARVLLVRVLVARDDLDRARVELARIDARADPDLIAQRDIAHGVLDARDAARARNTDDHRAHLVDARRLLGALERTRPDAAETVEMACALAETAAIETDPSVALRTIARTLATIEHAENGGTPWVRTRLRCEDPRARVTMIEQLAQRTADARALTDAIDASETGSVLRRPLALRLLDVARGLNDVPRYLRWLVDLPDDRATQSSPSNALSNASVVGLVIPLSGPRATIGTSVLRGAQLALERIASIRIALEDEGTDPSQTAAAIDRLFAQGARAIIGPTRDEFAGPAAIRAQSLSVPLFLLAVPPAIESTGTFIRAAAPSTADRAEAIAHAVVTNGRSPRALVVAPLSADPLAEATEDGLLQLGVSASHAIFEGTSVPRRDGVTLVFVGDVGREARLAIARAVRTRGASSRWVLDARSAMHDFTASPDDPGAGQGSPSDARTPGPWVGVRAGPGFQATLRAWCARFGESPDELSLLGHDAAVRASEALRRPGAPQLALDPQRALVTGTVAANARWSDALPAAAARCTE